MKRIKTHSWAKKRFKITKKWKIIHKKQNKSHLLMNKDGTNKYFKYWKVLNSVENKKIVSLFPKGSI